MKTVIVDGLVFSLWNNEKYYSNSKIKKRLHQYIWEKENGEIPRGYEIHHKDLNPLNNDLENLELLTVEEHRKLHSVISWDDERREWARNNLNEKARPKAIEWHKSDAGLEWHKQHYENTKQQLRRKENMICDCCGNEFDGLVNGLTRFCSNKCKSKWRRMNGLDDIEKVCVTCGKKFKTNKYKKTTNCSRSCSMKQRHLQNKLKDSPNLRE